MKIEELVDAPQWLRDADTENADVSVQDGQIVWHGGVWRGGVWRGGVWCGGEWRDGIWCSGVWRGGEWCGGVWRGGEWRDGVWCDGEWCGGEWCGGVWRGGVWHGGVWRGVENRLCYMAAALGIVFDQSGYATAYRTTNKDGSGRWFQTFIQEEGEHYYDNVKPPNSGTCVPGIHVTSPFVCHWYGVSGGWQWWEVKFKRENLLDCDGEKARINGGVFRKIERPF